MRLLQYMTRSLHNVAEELDMNYDVLQRKFRWETCVWKKDYEKLRPYAMQMIQEMQEEIEFLDIYFKQYDKLEQLKWPDVISERIKWRRREKEWDVDEFWWTRRDKRNAKKAREEVRTHSKPYTRRRKRKQVATA